MQKLKLIGGHLVLDFINSIDGRNEPEKGLFSIIDDKFLKYEDILDWAQEYGIIPQLTHRNLINMASQNPGETALVFERAINLREALFRIFKKILGSFRPLDKDVEILNKEYINARTHQKVFYLENEFKWRFFSGETNLDSTLWEIAVSACELLTSKQLERVKQCPGEDCGWLFLDISRNKSRQWCDMKDCGNLNKVRKFRKNKKLLSQQ